MKKCIQHVAKLQLVSAITRPSTNHEEFKSKNVMSRLIRNSLCTILDHQVPLQKKVLLKDPYFSSFISILGLLHQTNNIHENVKK